MKTTGIFLVLFCACYCHEAVGIRVSGCKRTNKKPYRYCTKPCSSNNNCPSRQTCRCDGDCGMSCVKQGLSCGKPPSVRNSRPWSLTGMRFNDTVTYTCRKPHQRRGPKKRVCRAIGKWDGRNTRCRIFCKDPGDINLGNRDVSKSYHRAGSRIRYRCFPNFIMTGSSMLTCKENGRWDARKPSCNTPTCGKPTIPANAAFSRSSMDKDRYNYNEVVTYKCGYGFYAVGLRGQKCLNSKWTAATFKCLPKSCGDPGLPQNGKRNGYVFTFKRRVSFQCNRGFMLQGPLFRQCQSNQRWSGIKPRCKAVDCGSLAEPQYGRKMEETKTAYQGKVVFECTKDGYELKGSKVRVCQENGNWDGTNTTCQLVECDDPGKPRYGGRNPDQNKYVFGDRVRFECKTNFTRSGEHVIVCQKDKTWTGILPTCLAPCPDPNCPAGGTRWDHDFRHGKQVRFKCRRGWDLEGVGIIRCNNGRWDHPAPKCLACGSPLGMENNAIKDDKITSSTQRERNRTASLGRLNGQAAWCSGTESRPFLQIDFSKPYRITALATQGSAVDNKWVKWFVVSINLAGSRFVGYREDDSERLFTGNRDASSVKRYQLKEPFFARRLRFQPFEYYGYTTRDPACMRVEIYGCDIPSSCVMVGSRVLGKWGRSYYGVDYYYKSYVTTIDSSYLQVELEDSSVSPTHYRRFNRDSVPSYVLDVIPKASELRVGTRVVAPWRKIYYAGTIIAIRGNRYRVQADDNDKLDFLIQSIRLLKIPNVCMS